MQIDIPTIWYLTIGTLLVSAAMTLWEREAHLSRSRALAIWAGSYLVFALGCIVAMNRSALPGMSGAALTNLLMVLGYLMVFHGAAGLDGPVPVRRSGLAIAAVAFAWTVAGVRFPDFFWNHVASLPIALICGLTARTLLRSRTVRPLRSRPVVAAIAAGHGLFYLARAVLVPLFVQAYGDGLLPIVARITMFEGVLYSVAMPMGFIALMREEAREQLLAQARTDYLTGLCNRQGFFEDGVRLLTGLAPGESAALLAFDLDHFKTINDRYGHATGDEVLKLFAGTARDLLGPDAILARLGGEEFAALLPGRLDPAARQVGSHIASHFAARAQRPGGLNIEATVSIGLADTRSGRRTLPELLSAADRALYRAKALGRNRIEIAEMLGIAAVA